MDIEEKKKIRRKITIASIVTLILVIVLAFFGFMHGIVSVVGFQVIACLYLLAYWAATDILEPKLTKAFEGITEDQKKSYKKYAGVDLGGYVGMMLFIVTAGRGNASNIGMFGILVYVLSLNTKKRFRMEFLHPEKVKKQQAELVKKKEISIAERAAYVAKLNAMEDGSDMAGMEPESEEQTVETGDSKSKNGDQMSKPYNMETDEDNQAARTDEFESEKDDQAG